MSHSDFCAEGHANGNCVLEGYENEARYVGNFSQGNPYSLQCILEGSLELQVGQQPYFKCKPKSS